jgi:hypothetical protein
VEELMALTRDDIHALAAKVRANAAVLRDCPKHEFEPIKDPLATPMRQRYRCVPCGGEIDGHAFFWYSRGRDDGGKC